MIKRLDQYIAKWGQGNPEPNVARLFRLTAYGWMLLNALYFLPIRGHLWGELSVIMPFHPEQSLSVNMAYILDHRREWALPGFYLYILWVVLSMLGIGWRIPRVLVFLNGWLLYYGCLPVFNSSFLLYQVFSFFLIFFGKPDAKGVNAIFSYMALWACRIQFVMVYLLAGGYKLTGNTWIEGSSIWYALNLDYFTSQWLRDLLLDQNWFLYIGNYFGLVYQVAFPFLIWWKPARIPLFIAGILFHGFIGVAMSLPEFALAMILGYTLFFEEGLSKKILDRIPFVNRNQKSASTMRSTL